MQARLNPVALFVFPFLLCIFLVACHPRDQKKEPDSIPSKAIRDTLLEVNRKTVEYETLLIDDFAARYKWRLQQTGTGLRYRITYPGIGSLIRPGQKISMKYSVRLLTGEMVRYTRPGEIFTFVAGRGEVITGLEEGILLLKKGSKVNFIVPSHLAFGVAGDPPDIPPRASLVFDIEIVDITNP